MIADQTSTERRQDAGAAPTRCELGRPLGDCSLRRAGCGSLFDVLTQLYPPPVLLAELRRRQDLDPSVVRWLQQLEVLTVREPRRPASAKLYTK